MLPDVRRRARRLLQLARERFNPILFVIERRVLIQSCSGEESFDWIPHFGADVEGPSDTEFAEFTSRTGRPLPDWQGPHIRTSLIRWVLTDPDAVAQLDQAGLRVLNARVTDLLDLSGCRIPTRLEFRYCLIEAPLIFSSADLLSLSIRNCTLLDTIGAQYLRLRGPLFFEDVVAKEILHFDGSVVEANVQIANSVLHEPLGMQSSTITNDLLLWPGFQSFNSLSLKGVRVGGLVILSEAKLMATGDALDLDSAVIRGGVFLLGGFSSAGRNRMQNAEIGGQLNCSRATLTCTTDALSLDGLKVKGGVFLSDGFNCASEVRMLGVTIDGQLNCIDAKLTGEPTALSLDRAKIRGGVFLAGEFRSSGEIRVLGAEIDGHLDCSRAELSFEGKSLSLDSVTIRGDLVLAEGFRAEGSVRLNGAAIEGQVNCANAKFMGPQESLTVHQARIGGSVFLSDGFEAYGIVSLHGTHIGGQLTCDGGSFSAFDGESMQVVGGFLWRNLRNAESASLYLNGARIKSIYDDRDSWPTATNLQLDGLVVDELHPLSPKSLATTGRIAWLNLQPKAEIAEPQPWIHLAKLLEDKGHKRESKRVIFELRKHQARINWKGRAFNWFGYHFAVAFARLEEQPFRILYSILVCVMLGSTVFWHHEVRFSPTSQSAYDVSRNSVPAKPYYSVAYPKFQPIVYALENVLPIVKLGQDDHWAPDANKCSIPLYWTLVGVRWFLILIGWAQGVILAAAVSARFRA